MHLRDAHAAPASLEQRQDEQQRQPAARSHTPAASSSQAGSPVSGSVPATSTRAAGTSPAPPGSAPPPSSRSTRRVTCPAGAGRLGGSPDPGVPAACAAGGASRRHSEATPRSAAALVSRNRTTTLQHRSGDGSVGRGPGGCRCLPGTPVEELGPGRPPRPRCTSSTTSAPSSPPVVSGAVPVIAQHADGNLRPEGADLRGSFRPGGCLSTCRPALPTTSLRRRHSPRARARPTSGIPPGPLPWSPRVAWDPPPASAPASSPSLSTRTGALAPAEPIWAAPCRDSAAVWPPVRGSACRPSASTGRPRLAVAQHPHRRADCGRPGLERSGRVAGALVARSDARGRRVLAIACHSHRRCDLDRADLAGHGRMPGRLFGARSLAHAGGAASASASTAPSTEALRII